MTGHARGTGHHFMGHDYVVMAFEDWTALTDALRNAFPQLRFYEIDEKCLVDSPATKALRIKLGAVDPAWPMLGDRFLPCVPTDRSAWKIRYFDGLDRRENLGSCRAWVEPKGWRPKWRLDERNHPQIANRPELDFRVNYSRYKSNQMKVASATPLMARSDDEVVTLDQGSWHGSYYDDKPHQKAFLAKVKRIVAKLTINRYARTDPETGAVLYRDEHGDMLRFGFHALEWARAHRNHLLDGRYKPIDWSPAP